MRRPLTRALATATLALGAGCATTTEEPMRLGDPFPTQTVAAEAHNRMVLNYWHILAVKCPFDGWPVDTLAMMVTERAPMRPYEPHRFDHSRDVGVARAEAALRMDHEGACKAVGHDIEADFPIWEKAVDVNQQAHNEEIQRWAHRKTP